MVEHKFIPADIAFFFQKKLTGHAVDIERLPLEADIGGVPLGSTDWQACSRPRWRASRSKAISSS
jgi:hypothetical protein